MPKQRAVCEEEPREDSVGARCWDSWGQGVRGKGGTGVTLSISEGYALGNPRRTDFTKGAFEQTAEVSGTLV